MQKKRKSQILKIKKGNKAITLISLVITIIILIILAGVSINLLIGENGLFAKAKEAARNMQEASEQEKTQINEIYDQIEDPTQTKEINIVTPQLTNSINIEFTVKIQSKTEENKNLKYIIDNNKENYENNNEIWESVNEIKIEQEEIKQTAKVETSGEYYIHIMVSDELENKKTQTSNKIVVDLEQPKIEEKTQIEVSLNTVVNEEYIKSINNISDNMSSKEKIVIENLTIQNSENQEVEGTLDSYDVYIISFNIKDEAGNSSEEIKQTIITKLTSNITLTNTISDSGFETDSEGWFNDATIQLADDRSISGKSVKFTSSKNQAFPLKIYDIQNLIGKNVYFSIWVNSDSQSTAARFAITNINSNEQWPQEPGIDNHVDAGQGKNYNEWKRLSIIQHIEWQYLRLGLTQADSQGTGSLWWDNLMAIDLSPFGDKTPTIKWLEKMVPYIATGESITL